ncbi:MAG TPA: cobalamin biosynthesis protein CobQ, partial [Desulfobacterales bacterium]|nr:cobalamin biosynthesis protein CobQ [Desulfobacterales bacterium]
MKGLGKGQVNVPIIAVTGGKGGTGKSTVAVNLAAGLSSRGLRTLLVDVDVDGPSCATLLGSRLENGQEVKTFVPKIDNSRCVGCRKCIEACPERALVGLQGKIPVVFEDLCSGCRACQMVCEEKAISEGWKIIGKIYFQMIGNVALVSGELKPTEARSPVMARFTVLEAIRELKTEKYDVAILDTAPGVHNAVAQPLWVSDFALAVTEPTPLGIHDLKFILGLTESFNLPTEVIINRANIPGGLRNELLQVIHERGLKLAVEIPLDEELWNSYVAGAPIIVKNPSAPAARTLSLLVDSI